LRQVGNWVIVAEGAHLFFFVSFSSWSLEEPVMSPVFLKSTVRRHARTSKHGRRHDRLLAEVLERRFALATFAGTTGTTAEQAIDANALLVSSVAEFTATPAYVLVGPSTSGALVQAAKTQSSPPALTNMSLWFGNGDFSMTNGSTTVTPAVTATSKAGVPSVPFGPQGSFAISSTSAQFPASNGTIAVQGNNGGWGVWQYDSYASGTFTTLAPIGTTMSGATSAAASMEILPGSTVVQAVAASSGTTLSTVTHQVESETLFDITIVSGAGFSASGGTAEWYSYGSQPRHRFTYTDMVSSGGTVTLQNCLSPDDFTIGLYDSIKFIPTVSLPVTTLTAPTLATPSKTIASLLDTPDVPLAVASTTGFPMAAGAPEYLLLETQAVDGSRTPQALLSYFSVSKNQLLPASGNGFALISGSQDLVLDENIRVVPAPTANTTHTPQTPYTFKTIMGKGPSLETGFIDVAGENAFADTGYIAVFGNGGYGIFSYDSSSTLPSSTRAGRFTGLTLVACQTGNDQDPYAITIPAGTNVIPAAKPAPSFTAAADVTGLTTWPLAVTATTAFNLPVVSTAGFPTGGGSVLVSMTVQGKQQVELVSYTAAVPNDGMLGGGVLQGCTAVVTGSIPVAASVTATATAPIALQFTNNSENNMPVYATIAAKQIAADGTWKWVSLEPQTTSGKPDLTKPLAAKDVTYTTGQSTYLSAFSLFAPNAAKGSVQAIQVTNDPKARLDSARVVFSYGQPTVIATVFDQGNNVAAPSFPDAGNPSDPNRQIHYDFFEFTERSAPNDGTIFVNTTQVDAVGLPFTLSVAPTDPSRTNGVGFKIGWNQLRSQFVTYVDAKTKALPTSSQVENAYLALLTAQRLLSPKDAFTNPPSKLDPAEKTALDTYFDAALTTFFTTYYSGPGGGAQQFKLQRDGLFWVGETKVGFNTNYTVMQFTQADSAWNPVAETPSSTATRSTCRTRSYRRSTGAVRTSARAAKT
jgi:hypothetical protein